MVCDTAGLPKANSNAADRITDATVCARAVRASAPRSFSDMKLKKVVPKPIPKPASETKTANRSKSGTDERGLKRRDARK